MAISTLICLVVLGSLGAQAVVQQDGEIRTWRQMVGDRSQTAALDSGVWLTSAASYPTGSGSELTVLTIAADRPGSDLNWPGLAEFPPFGTLMVSQSVAAANGDTETTIQEYVALPDADLGESAVIADEFLRTQNELLAVKFVAGDEVTPSPDWKPLEIGSVRQSTETSSLTLVALLLIFFASATLLITVAARFLHQNQPNLAAVRLQGAGRLGVGAVALMPIVVAALIGAVVGAMLFGLSRALASEIAPRSIVFVLDRARVPISQVLYGMTGVVVVVALMGLASIALGSRDSLSAVRSEPRPQRLPLVRLILLVLAVVLLSVDTASSWGALAWWIGVVVFLSGVLALGRLLLAFFANRHWTQPPHILGFGILSGSSREANLLYAPTVSVLFACALLVPLSSGLMYEDELSQVAHADVIVTDPIGGLGQLGDVRAALEQEAPWLDTGVVASLSKEVIALDSSAGVSGRHGLWVGGCADLKLFLGISALECKSGVAYFPPGLEPADAGRSATRQSGSMEGWSRGWRTHDLGSDLIYWVNPHWAQTSADDVASAWLAMSVGDHPTTEAVALISRRYPDLQVKVPDEHRETQRKEGQFLRTLVLFAIAVVALTTLATFTAAASNYLARRTPYLEHVLRMGLTKGALFISAVIVIVLPVIVGGLLVVPSGLRIGSVLADGTTPARYLLVAILTLVCSIGLGVIAAWIRVIGLRVRAPHRSLGGGGMGGRG